MGLELLPHPEGKMHATQTRTTALQKAFIAASKYACLWLLTFTAINVIAVTTAGDQARTYNGKMAIPPESPPMLTCRIDQHLPCPKLGPKPRVTRTGLQQLGGISPSPTIHSHNQRICTVQALQTVDEWVGLFA